MYKRQLQSGVVYDDKINYTLYNDGTLIFEGGGELEGFNQINEYFHSIWYNEYKDVIRNIVIGEGITRIGCLLYTSSVRRRSGLI